MIQFNFDRKVSIIDLRANNEILIKKKRKKNGVNNVKFRRGYDYVYT